MRRLILPLLLLLLALGASLPAYAGFFFQSQGSAAVPVTGQSVLSITVTPNTFTCGSPDDTLVGAVGVNLSPSSPPFSGTLGVSGGGGLFDLDSTTLPANVLTNSAAPCGNTTITITATAGAGQPLTNSPFSQNITITGIPQSVTGITLSNSTFTAGSPSGTTVGALSALVVPAPPNDPPSAFALASGISGCTGTDNASFSIGADGVSVQTVGVLSGSSYNVCASVTPVNTGNFTTSTCAVLSGEVCYQTFNITTIGQTIQSTSISNSTFTAGASIGTAVGTLSTVMNPTAPAFSGSYTIVSSGGPCSGGDTTHFAVNGSGVVTLASSSTTATNYIVCMETSQGGLSAIYTTFTFTGVSSALPAACTTGQPCVENTRIYDPANCTTGVNNCPGVYTNTNYTQPQTLGSYGLFGNEPIRAAELLSVEPGDTLYAFPATYTEGDIPMTLTHTIQCIGTYPSVAGPGSCILNPAAAYHNANSAVAFTTTASTPIHSTSLPITVGSADIFGGCGTVSNTTGGLLVTGTGIASPTYISPNGVSASAIAISAQTTSVIPLGATINIDLGCQGSITYGGFRNGPHGGMNPTVTYIGWQVQDVTNQSIPYTLNQAYTTTADTPSGHTTIQFSAAALTTGNGRPNGTLTGYQFANGGNTFVGQAAIPSGTTIVSGGVNYSTGVVTISKATTADIPSGTSITIVGAHGDGQCDGQLNIPEGHPTQCGGDAVGGIRLQSGSVTCKNCASFHDTNFILGNPFIYEHGTEQCLNCFIQYNGGGTGQSHAWYCGEVYECDVSNSVILDTNNGEGFKTRGHIANLSNNIIGDSDACPASANVASTWVPKTDGTGGWPGGNSNQGMANQVNGTQGGAFTLTNNIFCKSGTYATNVSTITMAAGEVAPWSNSSWTETGSQYYTTCAPGKCTNYLWPGLLAKGTAGVSISITGLQIFAAASADVPPTCILGQFGTCSGTVSINGGAPTTYVPTTPCLYDVMDQEGCTSETYDYRTSTSNVTVSGLTFPNTVTVLGPNNGTCPACTLTLASTALSNNTNVAGGPGGTTFQTNTSKYTFYDQAGDVPSTFTSAFGSIAANADNDLLNLQGAATAEGYVNITGRNITVNGCVGTVSAAKVCGAQWQVISSNGYVPTASLVGNYTSNQSGNIYCLYGCNISITGNYDTSFQFYGYPTGPGPATVMFNATTTTNTSNFNFQGCALDFGGTGGGSGQGTDWSDNSCRNFFYITQMIPSGLGTLHNTTVDFGPSTGISVGQETGNAIGAQVYPALVVGSGSATAALNPATYFLYPTASFELLEVMPTSMTGIHGGYTGDIMPKHLAGGSITITNYTAANLPYAPVIALGGMSLSCSGTTVSATDGITADNSTVVLQGLPACSSLNSTGPAGSQDGTLTAPATASGTHGTTIGIAVTLADAWWQNLNGTLDQGPGLGWARVCSNSGTVKFNGSSSPLAGGASLPSSFCPAGYTGITMAGRYIDMAAALTTLAEVLGPAGSSTLTIDTWNAGGDHETASVAVTSH